MRLFGLATGVILLALTTPALGKPTFWEKVREPKVSQAHRLLLQSESLLPADPIKAEVFDPADVVALLEVWGAKQLPDARLRFLLGELLINGDLGREAEARRLLLQALRERPRSPLAAQAWFNVAIASAKLGDSDMERYAYGEALKLEYRREARAIIYLNRAESNMLAGNLAIALDEYKRAVELSQGPTQALAHYGLGIALERSGDLPSALDMMAMADAVQLNVLRHGTISILDTDGVFFVPPYDLHYYKALVAMSRARQADTPTAKAEQYAACIGHWSRYLKGAIPDEAEWVSNAQLHKGVCERQLEQAKEAAPDADWVQFFSNR